MPLFSRNSNSRSNPGQSGAGSQQLTQPQNTYKRFKISLSCLFCQSSHHDAMPQVSAVDIPASRVQQADLDRHKQHAPVVNANDVPRAPGTHDSSNSASMQAGGRNSLPSITEPVTVPIATQFQGAQGVNISGNPQLTNIGTNTGNLTTATTVNNSTVNNYGGTHGLENLKEFVSFAALHDSAEQDPYRRCHPGTRENVLKRLRHWIDNPNPTDRIFWLYGPAGAGKSAIAQTIAHKYDKGEVAATFFFYRSDAGRNDGNRLFTTIAWQLAFSVPAMKDFIIHALDKTPHLPTKSVEPQFEQLVILPFQAMHNIASQMPWPAPVVVIDGVDECFNEQLQRRFLTVIGNAVKDCRVPLRFLICSRPEALIEETLDQFKDFTLRIDLAALDDSNRDIEKYLVDQFADIASKQGLDPSWPGQDLIEEIVFKSSGNFILASTLIRFIGDEDHSAVVQLDIVRKLKPHGAMSPFAVLDELYLEILKRQLDQDFLKTFLALLVGRSSIDRDGLHEDDAMLMNVSEKELHIKLRRMRSLLKFEPFIDVYHKSFLDFLQESSRSGQYYVSEQNGQKQYLELIVGSVVRHVSSAIEQPNCHKTCSSSPQFKDIVSDYLPKIVLPVEDWQEALKPLLDIQDKLLNTSKPRLCRVGQVMRDLLLQVVILQRKSHCIAAAQAPESTKEVTVTEWSAVLGTVARESLPERELDGCLSILLSCLPKTNLVLAVNATTIDHMTSLLTFDYAETAARVRSVSDAQKLIDFIDLLTNSDTFLSQCGSDAARKVVFLASGIFARVPLLPRFLLNGPTCPSDGPFPLEWLLQSVFISRILDHNHVVPVLWFHYKSPKYIFDCCNVNEQTESVHEWLQRSSPNLATTIRVVLEVARTIRYIHSMDITLYSLVIKPEYFVLDANLRVKVLFIGYFAWRLREASIYGHEEDFLEDCTYRSNVSAFADLFDGVCFGSHNENAPSRLFEDAKQLIARCRADAAKSRPTMEDVVTEMETWNLT